MRHPLKHWIEYIALRAVSALANCLPYRLALLWVWPLARLMFLCSPGRVREATRRLEAVFGARFTPAERRRLAWQSWRNMAFNGVEMLRAAAPATRKLVDTHVDHAVIHDTIVAHAATGKGGIVAVPHTGNWELAAATCYWHGIPIFSVTGSQRNLLTNAFLQDLRRGPGMEIVQRGTGTMKQVIRKLRAGGFLAIMPDVRVPQDGVLVPFLGGNANVGAGMALFARLGNVPVFPAYATRIGWSRQRYFVGAPIWPDPALPKDEDIARITRHVLAFHSAAVVEDPGQWFWFNRRWILDPVAPPPVTAPVATPAAEAGVETVATDTSRDDASTSPRL